MALLTPRGAGVGAALANGARVVWTGAPEPGIRFGPGSLQRTMIGIPFTAFAIFWTFMAVSAEHAPVFFPLWGCMFICIGLYQLGGHLVWDAYVRSNLSYAITDDGVAYIISGGEKTQCIYLPTVTNLQVQAGRDGIGSILFGDAPPQSFYWRGYGSVPQPPSFQFIKDVSKVFDICTQYQKKP